MHDVADDESMWETRDLRSDDEALADLRQSREDFASGDTFSVDEVRAELDRRRREGGPTPPRVEPIREI
jgi:antitoxin YefM